MTSESSHLLIHSFYDLYNRQEFDMLYQLLSENVTYSINHNKPSLGKASFIWHMKESSLIYLEQLTNIVIMVSEDGTEAAARYRFIGQYNGTGTEFNTHRKIKADPKYNLEGFTFFKIANNHINEINALFDIEELKNQIIDEDIYCLCIVPAE